MTHLRKLRICMVFAALIGLVLLANHGFAQEPGPTPTPVPTPTPPPTPETDPCTGLVADPASANVPGTTSVLSIKASGYSGNRCVWNAGVNGPSWASITAQNGGTAGNPGNGSVTVEFQANPDLMARNNQIRINATNADSQANSVTVVPIVQARNPGDFTLSITPSSQNVVRGASLSFNVLVNRTGGFTGSVCLGISGGLPSGTAAQFNPQCTTTSSSVLTIGTNAAAPLGTFTPAVTGQNGDTTKNAPALSYTIQDFSISLNPSSLTVVQGTSVSGKVTITPLNGFSGCVNLGPSNVPDGVGFSFNPNPACSGSSTMTVNANAFGALNSFDVTITGSNQGQPRTADLMLTVAGFQLTTCDHLTVFPGASGSCTVNINPSKGYSGSVTLSASNLPSGVTVTFNPNPTTGSSTMTVTVAASAAPGDYVINITGADGNVSKAVNVTLILGTPPVASRYVPVTPCRVVDTRNASGPFGGPILTGNITREFDIPNGACNIPSTALAYVLNATVVPSGSLGFLSMRPCGQPQPVTSNLNSIDGRVKAVEAIVPAGVNGGVCVLPSNDTHLVLDISGYFVPASTAGALQFYPLTPCRIADTRLAPGPFGGPSLAGGSVRNFQVLSSSCHVPAAAQAYSLNYTAVPNGSLGYLTTWPAGQTQPMVSTLNAPTGAVTANAAIVTAGSNGDISVFASNTTDLVIDINGYFAPPGTGGLSFVPLTPCRVLDTRNAPGSAPELDPQGPASSSPISGTLAVNVTASGCGIPTSAQAYVLNATVIPSATLGYLSLWPDGTPQPVVSTLNAGDGAVTSNLAIVPTTNGSIDVFASNPTHLVLDIFGYFAP